MKDLSLRLETMKLLEENIGIKLLDVCLPNNILDMTPKSTSNKIKNKQVGPPQTKMLLQNKRNHQQI